MSAGETRADGLVMAVDFVEMKRAERGSASGSRWLAAASLLMLALGIVTATVATIASFPVHFVAGLLLILAVILGLDAIIHRGSRRWIELAISVTATTVSVVLLFGSIELIVELATIALWVGGIMLARAAFSPHADLVDSPAPLSAVMFWNPKSGGGKALAADLAGEALARGIKPIELRRDDDLRQLVLAEIADGADALAAVGKGVQRADEVVAVNTKIERKVVTGPGWNASEWKIIVGGDRGDDCLGAVTSGGGERIGPVGNLGED